MYQRNIAPPSSQFLTPAKNKIKKLIKKKCKKNVYKRDLVYWRACTYSEGVVPVYVCEIHDTDTYVVITVFNLYL